MSEKRQLRLSEHAEVRCQQRGINRKTISLVYSFGKCKRTKDGFSYAMDQEGRLRAKRDLGETAYKGVADKLNFYVVVAPDDDLVITVAHRLKRHKI